MKRDSRGDDSFNSLAEKLKKAGVITADKPKLKGKVTFYNNRKGWGFIESGGNSYFLHFKQLRYDKPRTGEAVTFTPGEREGKPQALNVQRV